jgi:hypothetical protein
MANTTDGYPRRPLYQVEIVVRQFGTADRDYLSPDVLKAVVAMRENEYDALRRVLARVMNRPVKWNWEEYPTAEAAEDLGED